MITKGDILNIVGVSKSSINARDNSRKVLSIINKLEFSLFKFTKGSRSTNIFKPNKRKLLSVILGKYSSLKSDEIYYCLCNYIYYYDDMFDRLKISK